MQMTLSNDLVSAKKCTKMYDFGDNLTAISVILQSRRQKQTKREETAAIADGTTGNLIRKK